MEGTTLLLIALIVEVILFIVLNKLGYWTTYRSLVEVVINSIKDGKLTDDELEKIIQEITKINSGKDGNS